MKEEPIVPPSPLPFSFPGSLWDLDREVNLWCLKRGGSLSAKEKWLRTGIACWILESKDGQDRDGYFRKSSRIGLNVSTNRAFLLNS